jgi:hypothetical protein
MHQHRIGYVKKMVVGVVVVVVVVVVVIIVIIVVHCVPLFKARR